MFISEGVKQIEFILQVALTVRFENDKYLKRDDVKRGLYFNKLFKEGQLCEECWTDNLLECGQQSILERLWLPVELVRKVNDYYYRKNLLTKAVRRIYNGSVVEDYVDLYLKDVIPFGYLFTKLEKYGEEDKLLEIYEVLPKMVRKKLRRKGCYNLTPYICLECNCNIRK